MKNLRHYINLIENDQNTGWVLERTKSLGNAASKTTVHKISGKIVQYSSREAAQHRADVLGNFEWARESVRGIETLASEPTECSYLF